MPALSKSRPVPVPFDSDVRRNLEHYWRRSYERRYVIRIVIPGPGVVLVATYDGLFRSVDGGLELREQRATLQQQQPVIRRKNLEPVWIQPSDKGLCLYQWTRNLCFHRRRRELPNKSVRQPGAPGAGTYSCVTMTQSTQPDGKTLYASVAASGLAAYLGLYKSSDIGQNWARKPGAAPVAATSGQFGFNQTIGVDPQTRPVSAPPLILITAKGSTPPVVPRALGHRSCFRMLGSNRVSLLRAGCLMN